MPSRGDYLNSKDTRTSAESSYTTHLRVQDYNSVTLQHKNCRSGTFDDRQGRVFYRVHKRSPISQPHALGLRRGYPMGRQGAARPDSDEDCIRIGELPCYSHYAERLARLELVPIFKVLLRTGRNSNHAELRPTRYEASAQRLGYVPG